MPLTNGGVFQATRERVVIEKDGTVRVAFAYTSVATGAPVVTREIVLGAVQSQAMRDAFNKIVNASTPQSSINARDAYLATIDSLADTASQNNKLDI